jgi:putative membrane protein
MYLWLKALHIISLVAWFAGLFYMFRLFVYHTENKDSAEVTTLLKTMARRLYFFITMPAMVGTLGFGILLIFENPDLLKMKWLHWKFLLLLGLFHYHFYIGKVLRRFAKDDVYLTSKQCRIRNEVPTFFLITIVLLAILKP